MNDPLQLDDAFPPVSREAWVAKVEKDLKGKPWSDLQWHLEEDLVVDPFYHPDDFEAPPPPIPSPSGGEWEIGEYISVERNYADANRRLHTGLKGGVEAPLFRMRSRPGAAAIRQLLDQVKLTHISLHFAEIGTDKDPVALFDLLVSLAEEENLPKADIRGSIDFDPIDDYSTPPLDKLVRMIELTEQQFPQFRVLNINGARFHGEQADTTRELGYTLAKGAAYLEQGIDRGLNAEQVNRSLFFTMAVSSSYFVEIAKLRALRLLWANILAAYGAATSEMPPLIVHLAPETQVDDEPTNMIRAATQTMSAVLGGASCIYVLPANAIKEQGPDPFSLRIARNVQHLLKMESHLHRVADPAAGSYYIEKLTDKLANKAWTVFREVHAKRGFFV